MSKKIPAPGCACTAEPCKHHRVLAVRYCWLHEDGGGDMITKHLLYAYNHLWSTESHLSKCYMLLTLDIMRPKPFKNKQHISKF